MIRAGDCSQAAHRTPPLTRIGQSTPGPNLLCSPRLNELLDRAKGEYDMVILDTPPVLQMNSARVLGRMTDAVIMAARAAQSTRDLAAAARRLSQGRIRVLGTILNDWKFRGVG
jgi:Mrp family chromosome partitioning ATPase